MEAPIPGKPAVGIEVPNHKRSAVSIRSVFESQSFLRMTSPLGIALGKDIAGVAQVADLCKMPHLLIAGSTGSGKSVCVNSIIMSLVFRSSPEDVKLLLIDPKVVELAEYNGIPHLLMPVVTEPRKAAGAWAAQSRRWSAATACLPRTTCATSSLSTSWRWSGRIWKKCPTSPSSSTSWPT